MLKLTACLTMLCASCLTAGCGQKAPVEITAALFCDVEEPRRFSQAELDWRAEHAPQNLRSDFKTNLTGQRECGWFSDATSGARG